MGHNSPMRRLLPWCLLGLLGVVTAATAALGASGAPGAPPGQWVAGVLSRTAQAGSAHFSYAHVTTSPNPDLRATLTGAGVVDFSSGDFRVSEVDHDIEFEGGSSGPMHPRPSASSLQEIGIGNVLYSQLTPLRTEEDLAGAHFPFTRLTAPRQPRSQLGLSYASAATALGGLDGSERVVSVRDLGPAAVNRVATTEYLVETAPFPACPSAPKDAPVFSPGPTRLWLDAEGRLVQVRSTSHFSGVLPSGARALPAFAGYPVGPTTATDTLTFGAFGAPVHIAAPPPSALPLDEGSSTGGAFAVSNTCSRH